MSTGGATNKYGLREYSFEIGPMGASDETVAIVGVEYSSVSEDEKFYSKEDVDALIAEKDKEITRLDDLAHAHNIELRRKENLIAELREQARKNSRGIKMFIKIEGGYINLDLVHTIDTNDDGTATRSVADAFKAMGLPVSPAAKEDKYAKALRLLVAHDLIKDCPYKTAVKNLVKERG